MARFVSRRSRAFSVTILLLVLLLPSVASAGWGDEEWGTMIWGGVGVFLPSLSTEGLIALTTVLVLVSATLLARRHRGTRP
jgi:hypothetical protein